MASRAPRTLSSALALTVAAVGLAMLPACSTGAKTQLDRPPRPRAEGSNPKTGRLDDEVAAEIEAAVAAARAAPWPAAGTAHDHMYARTYPGLPAGPFG